MEKSNSHRLSDRIDINLLFILCLFVGISLVAVYSAQVADETLGNIVIKQAFWFAISAILLIPMVLLDMEHYQKLAWFLYGFGVLLLAFLIVAPSSIAHTANGAKSWYTLPGIGTFQPSEMMKPFYIVCLARVIARHHQKDPDDHGLKRDALLVLKTGLVTLIPLALIMKQPDLGTSLVIIAIYFTMLLVSRISIKLLAPFFGLVAAIGVGIIYMVIAHTDIMESLGIDQYQLNRILGWWDPSKISTDLTMQLQNSLLTIGTGGIYGHGPAHSPVLLPESQNDFIFSIIAGSFGFMGGAILIFLYFILIYLVILIGVRVSNVYGSYLCAGVVGMITFHVIENIGMVIGLLPITGIPLPFISYGGSSVLGSMISIGLVLSVKFHTRHYMFSSDI